MPDDRYPQSLDELEALLQYFARRQSNAPTTVDNNESEDASSVSFYPQSDVGWLGCFTSSVCHRRFRRLRSLESTTFPKSITGLTEYEYDHSKYSTHTNHLDDDVTDNDADNKNENDGDDKALHFSRVAVTSSSCSLCSSASNTDAVSHPCGTTNHGHHHNDHHPVEPQRTPPHHVRWIDLRAPSSCEAHDATTTTMSILPFDDLRTSREHLVHALPPLFYYRCSCYGCDDRNQLPINVNATSTTTMNRQTGKIPSDHKEEPNQHDSNRHYIINQYSPWYSSDCPHLRSLPPKSANDSPSLPQRQRTTSMMIADCTILVLPLPPDENNQDYYSLLSSFRISDIIPSIVLYSSMIIDLTQPPNQSDHIPNHRCDIIDRLSWLLQTPPSLRSDHQETTPTRFCQVLVYRKLPPRALLSSRHPEDPNHPAIPGCLYETVITYPDLASTDDDDDNIESEQPQQVAPTIGYRMVGPPYIDQHSHCAALYHHLQQFFLRPHVQLLLQREVQRIQEYFIAWPEAQHYHATANSTNDDDDNNPIVEAPWNVYPLCYCFPGNDVTQRQFIPKTCQFVPHTIQLLQECFNSFPVSSTYTFDDNHNNDDSDQVDCFLLRTALFSRLEPDSVLEAHTGWADLANHVYRVHIPIHIPKSESTIHMNHIPALALPLSSCCGTWVDGCVQYHDMNSIIMFDDSKVHRAFNYSQTSSRTVLILDVARPTNVYPIGTATGGHSNELDAFIEQFQ